MTVSIGGTPSFGAVFVFGDSLGDNGSVFLATGGAVPPASLNGTLADGTPVDLASLGIGYAGVFSNGPVYADIAADRLGLPGNTGSFLTGGSNFALGGGTALGFNPLSAQVDAFALFVATTPPAIAGPLLASSAASVFIGNNDLAALAASAITPTGPDLGAIAAGVEAIADEISAQTQRLVDLGVGTIIVNTLPPASLFPASDPFAALLGGTELLDGASAALNARLKADALALAETGVAVEIVDFEALGRELLADTATFGFDTLDAALSGTGGSPDVTLLVDDAPIDRIGFLDQVHFSAELHEVFGVFQAETLGNTQIDGDAGANFLRGGWGEETVFAEAGADLVLARGGDDLVFGGAGADAVFGGSGDDILFGGADDDLVSGGRGVDIVSGGGGDDRVFGGASGDLLSGDAGDDKLFGGWGADLILDGLGDDRAYGGWGADTFLYRDAALLGGSGGDHDLFVGGRGWDTLLVVTGEAVADEAAYLADNGIVTRGVEEITFVTVDAFASVDFGALTDEVATADLFGLV